MYFEVIKTPDGSYYMVKLMVFMIVKSSSRTRVCRCKIKFQISTKNIIVLFNSYTTYFRNSIIFYQKINFRHVLIAVHLYKNVTHNLKLTRNVYYYLLVIVRLIQINRVYFLVFKTINIDE